MRMFSPRPLLLRAFSLHPFSLRPFSRLLPVALTSAVACSMMLSSIMLSSVMLSSMMLSSCSSNDPVTPPNNSDTSAKGLLKGIILTYEKEKKVFGLAGVKVQALNTPYSTVTDDTGVFHLKIPSGTYTLLYTKDGFSELRSYQHTLAAPDTEYVNTLGMAKVVEQRLVDVSVVPVNDGMGPRFTLVSVAEPSIPHASNEYHVLVTFYRNDPATTSGTLPVAYWLAPVTMTGDNFAKNVPQAAITQSNPQLKSGDKLYATAQLARSDDYTNGIISPEYTDPVTKVKYYGGTSVPSNTFELTLF